MKYREVLACASNWGMYHVPGSNGAIHLVAFHGVGGVAECTCKAFEFSGRRRTCKHIERVREMACMYCQSRRRANPSAQTEPISYTVDRCLAKRCECGQPLVPHRIYR